ncbi:MAG: hypothetical protein KY462_12435 [Actinobacteria bacterium]|nr:hypothetical protein [Actinomycetota bacterium]
MSPTTTNRSRPSRRDPAADAVRQVLHGDDLVTLGIRADGPLAWAPDPEPAPTSAVERGRLRVLARRRARAIDLHRRHVTQLDRELEVAG